MFELSAYTRSKPLLRRLFTGVVNRCEWYPQTGVPEILAPEMVYVANNNVPGWLILSQYLIVETTGAVILVHFAGSEDLLFYSWVVQVERPGWPSVRR